MADINFNDIKRSINVLQSYFIDRKNYDADMKQKADFRAGLLLGSIGVLILTYAL